MKTRKMYLFLGISIIGILTLITACQPAAPAANAGNANAAENPAPTDTILNEGEIELVPADATEEPTTPPEKADPSPSPVTATPTSQPEPEPITPHEPLALINGTLITATGADPIPGGAILIEDGLITAIGPDGDVEIPEGVEIINVEGRVIMPGLIDARASTLLNRLELTDGRLNNIAVEQFLRTPLKRGVTTMRAVGWNWETLRNINEMQSALAALGNSIPTVLISGTTLTHGEGDAVNVYYPDDMVGVTTVDETRQTTEQLIDLGVNQVNLAMTLTFDGTATEADPSNTALSSEQLEAIVETSHSVGKRVIAQTIFHEDAEAVVAAGVDELMSWPVQAVPLSDDLISNIVENDISITTGFSVGQIKPQEGDVRRFLDAGGTLVFGTFAPNSGSTPDNEARIMFLQDVSLAEIVQAATINAAEALEIGDLVGSLEVGMQADIIVFDGNPLVDVRAYRSVIYVIKNGELVVGPE